VASKEREEAEDQTSLRRKSFVDAGESANFLNRPGAMRHVCLNAQRDSLLLFTQELTALPQAPLNNTKALSDKESSPAKPAARHKRWDHTPPGPKSPEKFRGVMSRAAPPVGFGVRSRTAGCPAKDPGSARSSKAPADRATPLNGDAELVSLQPISDPQHRGCWNG
jgi:hypothetical protein